MKNILKKTILFVNFIVLISFWSFSQDYCLGDYFNCIATDYVSGDLQWQYSFNNTDWYDFENANSTNFTFTPQENMFIRLKTTDSQCIPSEYYADKQYIYLIEQPTIANAGADQLGIMVSSVSLEANQPEIGTGYWTIMSGEGGNLYNPNLHNTSFSGIPNEIYVLRWRIYNPCGISDDFVTISFASSFVCGHDFVDNRDGQTYPTVSIGNQCWFAKNLNIGTMINSIEDQNDSQNYQKYCYANDINNCNVYGGLYQWNMAMQFSTAEGSRGICPEGWHIPTDNEFKQLELTLGMSSNEVDLLNTWRGESQNVGQKLKINGSSGFEALFGGAKNSGSGFMYIEGSGSYEFAYFWTSTDNSNALFAMRRCLQNASTGSGRFDTFTKNYGFSVRCLKD